MNKNNNISDNTGVNKEESADNLFVYQKSVEITEKRIDSIQRSIQNERNKAGVLLGFFFLIIIDGLKYFQELPMFLKGCIFILVIFIFILLIQVFSSVKMKEGVKTDDNFNEDWKGRKNSFLQLYNDVLLENIEEQKGHLTNNSKNIKIAIIFLSIIILTLLINVILL